MLCCYKKYPKSSLQMIVANENSRKYTHILGNLWQKIYELLQFLKQPYDVSMGIKKVKLQETIILDRKLSKSGSSWEDKRLVRAAHEVTFVIKEPGLAAGVPGAILIGLEEGDLGLWLDSVKATAT